MKNYYHYINDLKALDNASNSAYHADYKLRETRGFLYDSNTEQERDDFRLRREDLNKRFESSRQKTIPEISSETDSYDAKALGYTKPNTGYSLPFVEKWCFDFLKAKHPHLVPKSIHNPTASEVLESDKECVKRFTTRRPRLRRAVRRHITRSASSAITSLGCFAYHNKERGITVDQAVLEISKNTNSGFPLFKKKNSKECIGDTISWVRNFLIRPSFYSIMRNPCVLFHRFQPKITNEKERLVENKIRQVWCYPQRIVALENLFFFDVLDNVKHRNVNGSHTIYSSGLTNSEISDKIVKRLRFRQSFDDRYTKSMSDKIFSLDYSKYDSTVPSVIFDIFFSMTEMQSENPNVKKYNKVFRFLRFYEKYTPFLFEDKYMLQELGVGSGSLLTNLIDTIWNLTLWYMAKIFQSMYPNAIGKLISGQINYVNLRFKDDILSEHFRFPEITDIGLCGDDVIILCSRELIEIHKRICQSFFMTINVFNITYTPENDIYFLGRYWNRFNEPFNSEFYLSTHIITRTKWYSKDEVYLDIDKDLTFNRILSICCPLSNGIYFLKNTFFKWGPMKNFLRRTTYFTYLKDWIDTASGKYPVMNVVNALDWRSF